VNREIRIHIGARSTIGEALKAAIGNIRDFSKATVEEIGRAVSSFRTRAESLRDSLAMESEAFQRMHKSALSAYETLDEINKRVDAPKAAARAQEEHNRALARYCELLKTAEQREKDRYAKRHYFNAFDKDTFGNLDKLHGTSGGGKGGGANAADAGIKNVAKSARAAIPALMMMMKATDDTEGSFGKLSRAMMSVAGMAMAFGPVGVALAAFQAAIGSLSSYFKKKADQMVEKAKELHAKVKERLATLKEERFDGLVNSLSVVAKAADSVAEAFERAAQKKKLLTAAANKTVDAMEQDELADMRMLMAQDVNEASEDDKERVGAAWKVKIAEKEAEIKERAANRAREMEEMELEIAEERLRLTEKNAAKLEEAAEKAVSKYAVAQEVFGKTDKAYVKRFRTAAEQAANHAKKARDSADKQRTELMAEMQNKQANDIERETSVKDAKRAVTEAESTYNSAEKRYADKRIENEKKVADERARLDAQEATRRERERQKELAARIRDHQKLLAAERAEESKSRSAVSAAESKLQQAWGWYRDKNSMAAQIAEEKADAQARKQFEKDFEKLKDRRRDWRTAENLSVDDEAVRRVALAREEKEQAEKHLAEIEKNTAGLAEKLDNLLTMKGA